MNGDDAQTIEKIFSKFSRGYGFFHIAVGGGDNTHVDIDLFGAPQRPNLALLQDAIQFDLHRWAHVPDFVEEQRSAMCSLKEPLAILVCSCESSLEVTE